MFTWIHVAILLVASVAAGVVVQVVHHRGFVGGQNEREAHCAPLLQAARDAKDAANLRAAQQETNAQKITTDSETDHALLAQVIVTSVGAANARIADVLRERAARQPAACREPLRAVPGIADEPAGAAAGDERDQRFSASVSDVGGRCQHDATQVTEFQQWVARQRANAQQVNQ